MTRAGHFQGAGDEHREGLPDHRCYEPGAPHGQSRQALAGCYNPERLNGENGLLLTFSIDHLSDRGFIGFQGNGDLIISPVAHGPSLERMGIDTRVAVNVGPFTTGQRELLEFHRAMRQRDGKWDCRTTRSNPLADRIHLGTYAYAAIRRRQTRLI